MFNEPGEIALLALACTVALSLLAAVACWLWSKLLDVTIQAAARRVGVGLLGLGLLSALALLSSHLEAGGVGGAVAMGALALGGIPAGLLATWYGYRAAPRP